MHSNGPSIDALEPPGASEVDDSIRHFAHTPGTKIHFGCGTHEEVGSIAQSLGGTRALVVTDPGIAAAGHLALVKQSLEASGLVVTVFQEVVENPTTETVDACVAVAKQAECDLLVGLGGGSSMDAAKGCNFILTNGGRMQDYWGHDKATKPMLPLIAIPTTAGTGSECQSYALISDAETHAKMACGDPKAAAKVAILDPDFTATQPPVVAAHTGIDALAHAIESAVSTKRNPVSMAYSKVAYGQLAQGFPRALADGTDLEARARMLLGAAYAGTAIENSMLGAAHAAANPLTATFDVVHGEAVGLMLPHVIRLNASNPEIADLYRALSGETADVLAEQVSEFLVQSKMPTNLRAYEITDDAVPALAEAAATQWTAQFNPVSVAVDDFKRLYSGAL